MKILIESNGETTKITLELPETKNYNFAQVAGVADVAKTVATETTPPIQTPKKHGKLTASEKKERQREYQRAWYAKHHEKKSAEKEEARDLDVPMTDEERYAEQKEKTKETPLCQECLGEILTAKTAVYHTGLPFHKKCWEKK